MDKGLFGNYFIYIQAVPARFFEPYAMGLSALEVNISIYCKLKV